MPDLSIVPAPIVLIVGLAVSGVVTFMVASLERAAAGRHQHLAALELQQPVLVRTYTTQAAYQAHARMLLPHGYAVSSVVPQSAWNCGPLVVAAVLCLALLVLFWPLSLLVALAALVVARKTQLIVTYTRTFTPPYPVPSADTDSAGYT